ncbi:MAG: substrate-binding domain-containing protein [Deltaproteobacteria bacterium]|nr:substrate-binding domain-containing protein [Deltaproteobacteria bacterium]
MLRRTLLYSAPALALLGCHTRQPKAGAPRRIGLVMKSLANEFYTTMAEGARKHQAQHARQYELIINGIKDEQDVARQSDLVDQTVAMGADALVIVPADARALIASCRRAMRAGVVVVNIVDRLDANVLSARRLKIPYVGPDNRKGAALVGRALAQQLPPSAPVAIIEGMPTAFSAISRRLGFEDAIKAAGLTLLVSQAANWDMGRAHDIANAIMTQHPQIKGFMVANDNMALGVAAAVKAASKARDIKVVGFDNIAAVQGLIKAGEVLATADQHADALAVYGIEYALELLQGHSTPDDRETPIDLIDAKVLRT